MLEKVWRKGNPPTLLMGIKLVQTLWRTVERFLKKLNTELPHNLTVIFLDIYLEKTMIQKDTCTPKFNATLFKIAKTWQPKYPLTEEWTLLSHKKTEIMPFVAI